MSIIALIPARSGSKRIPDKNIRYLGSHPLIAYTIQSATDSSIFESIIVSTDSPQYAEIAEYYGALVPWLRPPQFSTDTSPDREWIEWTLAQYQKIDKLPSHFMILRPTSPFRDASAIRVAWETYETGHWMKMVEPVSQHPYKTWIVEGGDRMTVINMELNLTHQCFHALPTQCLPTMYVQTGALEIRPTSNIEPSRYQAFVVNDLTGYDINTEKDWVYAEWLITNGKASLPEIHKPPYVKDQGRLC